MDRAVEPGREIEFLRPAKRSQCAIVEQIAPVVERPVIQRPVSGLLPRHLLRTTMIPEMAVFLFF